MAGPERGGSCGLSITVRFNPAIRKAMARNVPRSRGPTGVLQHPTRWLPLAGRRHPGSSHRPASAEWSSVIALWPRLTWTAVRARST